MQLLKGVRSYGVNFILMMLLYANKQTNHQKTKPKITKKIMVKMRGNIKRWGCNCEDGNSQNRSFHVFMVQKSFSRSQKVMLIGDRRKISSACSGGMILSPCDFILWNLYISKQEMKPSYTANH